MQVFCFNSYIFTTIERNGMKRYIYVLLAACLLVACSRGNPEITTGELFAHVSYLASEKLGGRLTGTEGDSLAADYIRRELRAYGLVPFVDDGFQRFWVNRTNAGTKNVAMVLPGKDPVLRNEYVVIGAHFDHLGYGGEGSSSRMPDTIAVHYGADDNASGVALMLEIAQKFASRPGGTSRSIIFVAFAAEEMGLLGARHFVDQMPVSPASINAMINLDMVGRLKEESLMLQVGGAGTAKGMRDLLMVLNDTARLKLALSDEGYGPSDHSAFYIVDIPVIFVSTGPHLDYHTPYDTKDRINYEGMIAIADFVYGVADSLAGNSERLAFTEAGPRQGLDHGARRGGISLGIMPDFSGVVSDGLRADFVTPGRPAALGGMMRGDIIKSINGKPVNNIEEYMIRLNQLKAGETISVEILRGENTELLIIQL